MTAVRDSVARAANDAQRRAAEPAASVWVAASAGTGKTKVLTDRVVSLLLAGTEPARILCLTFTKAAAAEMANRIAARLGRWAVVPDRRLARELMRLTGRRPDLELCQRARRMFADVLDAPGGMKIETIHAFCQSLLRRFPLEAGIAPHFEVLDQRSAGDMMLRAPPAALPGARSDAGGSLATALATVTGFTSEEEFAALMQTLAGQRGRLADLVDEHGGIEGVIAAVRQRLGAGPAETPEALLRAACDDAALDLLGLRLAVTALAGSRSTTDRARGAAIAVWLAAPPEARIDGFDAYAGNFLTATGTIRASLITRPAAASATGADDILHSEAERLLEVAARRRSATVAAATAALLALSGAMLQAYEREKARHAGLDYDDLVLHARDLLQRPGVAPWVLFKLDGGLDHVLIDEAQDTSPRQWDVVAALAAEFFVGASARDATRTVFVVGDGKQSIFSFQGADPAAFVAMHAHFRDRARVARAQWREVPLDISFRSTAAVLQAVDAVFAADATREGVALDGRPIRHRAIRTGAAGLVELWPPVPLPDAELIAPWSPPVEPAGGETPRGRLAQFLAARIASMIHGGEMLPARGRAIRPDDIMVLVRRRNAFLDELVRELKQRNIAVAGVDRMVVTEQLAVMDLVALGEFLLLPDDDLALAVVLKSPLVGLDEDALYALAHDRGGRSLWTALLRRREERDDFAAAATLLAELLAEVDFMPPYELFGGLLGRRGARRRLLARLGPEAADPVDEFMTLALQYERDHTPTLQGFLRWLQGGKAEIKRDLEQGGGKVRVMTVHGAKGLQAPIVFLPDTLQLPTHTERLLWRDIGDSTPLPYWSPRVGFDDDEVQAARAVWRREADREYRRLLYVAMTRAEDRLYVCGWQTRSGDPPDGCWHALVGAALAGQAEPFAFDASFELGARGWSGTGLRLACRQERRITAASVAAAAPSAALPAWTGMPPVPERLPLRPLAPSRPPGEEPPVRSPLGGDGGLRFRRGRLIHRLLQTLPDLPAARRDFACRRFLARPLHGLPAAQQEEIAAATMAVLGHPEFAPLFGPGSLAEVPVVGEVAGVGGRPQPIAGQIDRMLVTENEVLIVDYKSNRPAPESEESVPEPYLRQMAAYRAALGRIYPDRPITCALLWTDGPRLMRLDPARLDRCLP